MAGFTIDLPGHRAEPGPHGLLVAFPPDPFPTLNGVVRAGMTVQTEADSCDAAEPLLISCEPTTKPTLDRGDVQDGEPFWVFGVDSCSTIDPMSEADRQIKAQRNLDATMSWQFERRLFDGEGAGAGDAFLTDGNAVVALAGPLPPMTALAVLEASLGALLHGQQGVILATRDVVSLWHAGGALEPDDPNEQPPRITTILDTIVVGGSGFSGNDPDGGAATAGTSWAYAVGMVRTFLGPQRWVGTGAEIVDREVNTTTIRREAAGWVDYPPCGVLAVQIDITP